MALLTLKGTLHIYEVVNPEIQSIDSVRPLFYTSIQDVLKN
jgi:hypothetical protein